MSFPVEKVRADFPVLTREVNGLPLAYLDSAASAQNRIRWWMQKPNSTATVTPPCIAYSYAERRGDPAYGERPHPWPLF